jgi:hypothetical protein
MHQIGPDWSSLEDFVVVLLDGDDQASLNEESCAEQANPVEQRSTGF